MVLLLRSQVAEAILENVTFPFQLTNVMLGPEFISSPPFIAQIFGPALKVLFYLSQDLDTRRMISLSLNLAPSLEFLSTAVVGNRC